MLWWKLTCHWKTPCCTVLLVQNLGFLDLGVSHCPGDEPLWSRWGGEDVPAVSGAAVLYGWGCRRRGHGCSTELLTTSQQLAPVSDHPRRGMKDFTLGCGAEEENWGWNATYIGKNAGEVGCSPQKPLDHLQAAAGFAYSAGWDEWHSSACQQPTAASPFTAVAWLHQAALPLAFAFWCKPSREGTLGWEVRIFSRTPPSSVTAELRVGSGKRCLCDLCLLCRESLRCGAMNT